MSSHSSWTRPGTGLLTLLLGVGLAACGGGGSGSSPAGSNAGGGGSGSGGGGASAQQPPTLILNISALMVTQGAPVTLTWSAVSADSCTASGAWAGTRVPEGAETLTNLQQSASYTLRCDNSAGSVTRTVSVTVAAAPRIDLTITPALVERGSVVTLAWSATWATECLAQWAVTGTPPTLPPEGSVQYPIAANYAASVLRVGVQCTGPNGTWSEAAEAPVKTLSGELRIPEGVYVDTDVNDPNAEYESNDATPLGYVPAFGAVPGYVNVAGQGPAGRSFASGDEWDYFYLASDVADQVVRLRLPALDLSVPAGQRDDADLYIYDRDSGALVDASLGAGAQELIELPATGTFVVGVKAERGGMNYVLTLEDPPTVNVVGAATLASEFVPGEAIVALETAVSSQVAGKATALMNRKSGESGREMLVTFANASSVTARGASEKARRPWFGQKAQATLSADMREKLATLQEIKRLSQLDGVRHASVNRILHAQATPTDPMYARQRWHYEAARLPQAWDLTTGSSNVIVAVIDSGAVVDHPDLQGKFVDGYDMVDRDSNYADTGFDSGGARIYHGTHVMGTIAALANNGVGGSGIAWGSRIMPIRALNGRSGSFYDILQAVRYAAGLPNDSGRLPARRADIVNLSLGSHGACDPAMAELFTTVSNSGVIVVASAGNDRSNTEFVPASCPTVFSVAAAGSGGSLAPYSNFGTYVSLGAPGGDMLQDLDNDRFADGVFSTGGLANGLGYSNLEGTSMAAPHVSGIFALMKSVRSTLNPLELRQLLEGGWLTDPVATNSPYPELGRGLINAYKAVQAANDDFTPPAQAGWTPSVLSLSRVNRSGNFTLRNAGIGPLSVTSVQPAQSWLTITPQAVGIDGLGVYEATVNYTTLLRGVHHGAIEIQSSAGTKQLPVVVNNVHFGIASRLGGLYVRAIDPTSGATIRTLQISDRIARYRFDDLPLAGYVTLAGTDMNNDGNLCDPGEVCGMYPVRSLPAPIEFTGVKERVNFDLLLTGIERQ
jgi:serine protease